MILLLSLSGPFDLNLPFEKLFFLFLSGQL